MKDRLHWSHFKAGLNNLDMDDIHYLHQTDAFREFNWLNQLPDGVKNFMTLRDVYCELNLIIEDRIIQRFPGIARASPAPTQRQLRAKHGTALKKALQ